MPGLEAGDRCRHRVHDEDGPGPSEVLGAAERPELARERSRQGAPGVETQCGIRQNTVDE